MASQGRLTTLRERPLAWALAVVAVVALVRTAEVVLGVHEQVGTLVLSPVLALVLAGVVLWLTDATTPGVRLPLDRSTLGRAGLVGLVGVGLVQTVAHLTQAGVLFALGERPTIAFDVVNPAAEVSSADGVLVTLLVGVLLTAVAEELLFRGVLLDALARRYDFWPAAAGQALAFGLWHLAWPLALVLGPADPPVPLPVHAVGFVVVTGFVGGVFAVLARGTGSLWTPILAHLVHNAAGSLVFVRLGGAEQARILAPALVLGYAVLAWLGWWHWDAGG